MLMLPIGRFQGEIHVVTTQQEVALALRDLLSESVVGLDTETRPSFRKGETHLPCLLQAASARAVYLFQLSRMEAAASITELLEAPHISKAGVALAHDLRSLKQLFLFQERTIVDLGLAARRAGFTQTGLRNLVGIFLGFRIPKGNRTSNWAAPRLSPAQINYAATDAWVCRELFLRFESLGMLAAAFPAARCG